MNRIFTIIFLALLIQGCGTVGHKKFYTQAAPTTYPQTEKLTTFEYSNVDLEEIYNLLFSDFLIIGRSSFNGPYESQNNSTSFAKSIGADVFISSSQFKETKTTFSTFSTPTTNRAYISGYSGSGSYYATATTYGTRTTTVPISVDRYDQDGLYLRNVKNVTPLWKRTRSQYKRTESSSTEGFWFNKNYKLHQFKSGQQMVSFISGETSQSEVWKQGDLKFAYGTDSGVGVYLMGDKTPVPAEFKINKFGHLEVKLFTSGETFSFARQ